MSTFESSMSDDESDTSQTETKRFRYTYTNRRYERPKARRRLSSKDTSKDLSQLNVSDSVLEGLIMDNGGHSIKLNYSFEDKPKVIPNCIMKAKSERKRLFIGSQIDECRDCSGLFYLIPTERGYITKWDVQKPIWDYIFTKNVCPIKNYPIVITQPLFNFKSIQDCIDEIFFEEYDITAMYRTNPTDLALVKYHQEVGSKPPCLIIDCGYSFTHIIPYLEGEKYLKGVKRLNVGGKLLTNHLKDVISYRQYHVMEETYVINQVKEDTCFVSQDFKNDLRTASLSLDQNTIVKNYVLPDFNNIRRGYIHDLQHKDEVAENCQILRLNNERFTVPEILFHPSDIGIKSIGLAEAVYSAILACPKYYQKALSKNIVCIGGSCNFGGFRDRLEKEIRSMIPASWEVNLYQPKDVVGYSWMGGRELFRNGEIKSKLVTRQEYEELGMSAIQERFNQVPEVELHEDVPKREEVVPISYIDHVKKYDVFGKGVMEEANENSENNDDAAETRDGENKLEREAKNDGEKQSDEEKSEKSMVEDKGRSGGRNFRKSVLAVKKSNNPIVYSIKLVSTTKPVE